MQRLIIEAPQTEQPEYAKEVLKHARSAGDCAIMFDADMMPYMIKEWMIAAQGLVVYKDHGTTIRTRMLIDFAVKIGLSISYRTLNAAAVENNQDAETA